MLQEHTAVLQHFLIAHGAVKIMQWRHADHSYFYVLDFCHCFCTATFPGLHCTYGIIPLTVHVIFVCFEHWQACLLQQFLLLFFVLSWLALFTGLFCMCLFSLVGWYFCISVQCKWCLLDVFWCVCAVFCLLDCILSCLYSVCSVCWTVFWVVFTVSALFVGLYFELSLQCRLCLLDCIMICLYSVGSVCWIVSWHVCTVSIFWIVFWWICTVLCFLNSILLCLYCVLFVGLYFVVCI